MIQVAKLNNDPHADLLFATLGNGLLAMGDLNGDKVPDVVNAMGWSGTTQVYFGTGLDYLSVPIGFYVSGTPHITDCNRDGRPDILVVGSAISVILNVGIERFDSRTDLVLVPEPKMLLGDLNQDGNPDLLGSSRVLLGDGKGGFTAQPHALGAIDSRLLGDWTGDGKLDLAGQQTLASGQTLLTVRKGIGTIDFDLPLSIAALGQPVAIADWNGDRKDDLVLRSGTGIQILLNQSR